MNKGFTGLRRLWSIVAIITVLWTTIFAETSFNTPNYRQETGTIDISGIPMAQYNTVLQTQDIAIAHYATNPQKTMHIVVGKGKEEPYPYSKTNTRTAPVKHIYYSKDAENWTEVKLDDELKYETIFGIEWLNDRFVAYGRSFPQLSNARYESYIAWSKDGVNWTEQRVRAKTSKGREESIETLKLATYGNGTYIFTGEERAPSADYQYLLFSKDLKTFEKVKIPINNCMVFFFKDKFMAISEMQVGYSKDGKTWTVKEHEKIDFTKKTNAWRIYGQVGDVFKMEKILSGTAKNETNYKSVIATTKDGVTWSYQEITYPKVNATKYVLTYSTTGSKDSSVVYELGNDRYLILGVNGKNVVHLLDKSVNANQSTVKLTELTAKISTNGAGARKPNKPLMIDEKGTVYACRSIASSIYAGSGMKSNLQLYTLSWAPDDFISPEGKKIKDKNKDAFVEYNGNTTIVKSQLGEKDMGMKPILVGTEYYVPVQYLVEPFGFTAKYDKQKNVLYLNTK